MEFGSIEREIYIDAAPEIVFAVVSDPEHVSQWWPDEASYEVVAGSTGEIRFGDLGDGGKQVSLTVAEVDPPRRFAFRWTQPAGEKAADGNSLLVTFDLQPQGDGTLLKFAETGFRELGWEAAKLEEIYNDHVRGWAYFLPRLAPQVQSLAGRS